VPRPLAELADTGDRPWVWQVVATGVFQPTPGSSAASDPGGGGDGSGNGSSGGNRDDDGENNEPFRYPGPLPCNLPLGGKRHEALARLAEHKHRPRRSGLSDATDGPWDRIDLKPQELKCSFSDGIAAAPSRHQQQQQHQQHQQQQVRYSTALSNMAPLSLLLVYSRGGRALLRSTFLVPAAADALEAALSTPWHSCEPQCDPVTCPARTQFRPPMRGALALADEARRDAEMDVIFGRECRGRVDHWWGAGGLPLTVSLYHGRSAANTAGGTNKPSTGPGSYVLVTGGVSARSMAGATGDPLAMSSGGGGLMRQGSSSSLISAAAGAARSSSSASASAGPAQRRGSAVGSGNALPAAADPNPQPRCELLMHCDDPRDVYWEWVRHVARVASGAGDPEVRVFHGMIVRCPRGGTQVTLAMGQAIEFLLLINTSSGPEAALHNSLRLGDGVGEPVKMMAIVPITALERSRAAEIVDRLGKTSTPVVFRENRPAYVV
jgi:hypothetical protein